VGQGAAKHVQRLEILLQESVVAAVNDAEHDLHQRRQVDYERRFVAASARRLRRIFVIGNHDQADCLTRAAAVVIDVQVVVAFQPNTGSIVAVPKWQPALHPPPQDGDLLGRSGASAGWMKVLGNARMISVVVALGGNRVK
jgi:hypothetical protein